MMGIRRQTGRMKFVKQEGCADAEVHSLSATDQRDRYPDGTLVDSTTVTLEEYRAMEERRQPQDVDP